MINQSPRAHRFDTIFLQLIRPKARPQYHTMPGDPTNMKWPTLKRSKVKGMRRTTDG